MAVEKSLILGRMRLGLLTSTILLTISGTALAQSQPLPPSVQPFAGQDPDHGNAARDKPTSASNDDDAARDIIVTALKQRSTLLRTPAAITVLNGANLKTQGVNSLQDVQNLVPNVDIATGRDGVQVAIRGVTTTDTTSKGEQDIAFNIDGIYVGRGNARGAAFFDIDRIEVLRGPQGTVYGRSATGGAINVITNRPILDSFSGYVKAEYGNYNAKRAEGAINIPLGDKIAIRLAGNVNDRDGYSKPIDYNPTINGVAYNFPRGDAKRRNDQKDKTGRASILFQPSTDFSLRLTATLGHQGGVGNAVALETQLKAHDDHASGLGILADPVPSFQDSNFQNYDANLNYKLGAVQFDLLGSYQHLKFKQQSSTVQDVNGGYGLTSPVFLFPPESSFGPVFSLYLQQNEVKTSQFEGRISNAEPERMEFVAGANYFHERTAENGQSWDAQIDDPLNTDKYYFYAGPVNVTTHEAYGLFGQATFHFNDRLSFVGGVRYTHDKVARLGTFGTPFNFAAGFPFPPFPDANGDPICHYPDTCVGAPNNGSESDSKITWRAGINYQLSPSDLIYASVATGFKGGGFNDYDPAVGGIGKYSDASVTAYEVGYKGRPFKGLTLTSDIFYYDFSRDQITGQSIFAGNVTSVFTKTVPVTIYGWENEFSYQVARQTTLSGSASYLHSNFRNFEAGQYAYQGDPVDFTHRSLDLSPTFSATAALNQSFDLTSDVKLRLRGAVKYSGAYFISDYADGVRYRQPSFTRSDLSATFDFHNGRYALQLFVENLENKVQRTSIQGYQNVGPYGGVGGYTPAPTSANPSPLPVPGNTHIGSLPPNDLAFYTTSPRFFGIRGTINF